MKYSIIVPVYNTPPNYLRGCLDSLSIQQEQNAEIIVVDDGSTEPSTLEVLKTYESSVVVIRQENQGVAAARNTGVEASKGQWICFVDADDCLLPAALSSLDHVLSSSAQIPDIVVFDCYVYTDGHDEINHFYPQQEQFRWNDAMRENTLVEILGKNVYYNPPYIGMGVPWGKLYRKDFMNRHNLRFPEGLPRMEDNIFNLYAFGSANYVLYCNQPLYRYSIVVNSASKSYSPDILEIFTKVNELTSAFLNQYKYSKRLCNAEQSRIVQEMHTFMKFWIFNKMNPQSYHTKKKMLFAIAAQNPYYYAIHHLDFSLTDKSVIVLSILLRMRMAKLLSKMIVRR
ncbi:MAG: glycosyltransferase [Bifidobacterium animalis]|nr:glycosyltransferase [Bifidobacterium animalis]